MYPTEQDWKKSTLTDLVTADSTKEAEDTVDWDTASNELFAQFLANKDGIIIAEAMKGQLKSLETLENTVKKIDESIRAQVVGQNKELLSQSHEVSHLKESLKGVRERCTQLTTMEETSTYLRALLRLMKLQAQMKAHMREDKDMKRAALCVAEMQLIIDSSSLPLLSQIEIVQDISTYAKSACQSIRDLAKHRLITALKTLNQAEMATNLQIMCNLGRSEMNQILVDMTNSLHMQC
ncbi:hypothetical protein RFI_02098, partial [Reticulomyxa filosa]